MDNESIVEFFNRIDDIAREHSARGNWSIRPIKGGVMLKMWVGETRKLSVSVPWSEFEHGEVQP